MFVVACIYAICSLLPSGLRRRCPKITNTIQQSQWFKAGVIDRPLPVRACSYSTPRRFSEFTGVCTCVKDLKVWGLHLSQLLSARRQNGDRIARQGR